MIQNTKQCKICEMWILHGWKVIITVQHRKTTYQPYRSMPFHLHRSVVALVWVIDWVIVEALFLTPLSSHPSLPPFSVWPTHWGSWPFPGHTGWTHPHGPAGGALWLQAGQTLTLLLLPDNFTTITVHCYISSYFSNTGGKSSFYCAQ